MTIQLAIGRLGLGPQGELLQLTLNPTPAFTPAPPMGRGGLTLLIVSLLLSIALAVLLLWAGIVILRQSRKSRRLHLPTRR